MTTGNINGRRSGSSGTMQTVTVAEDYAVSEPDGGKLLDVDSGVRVEVLLGVNVSTGFTIDVMRRGAGDVLLNGTGGATLRSRGDRFLLTGQWSCATATCVAPGEWLVCGDVSIDE